MSLSTNERKSRAKHNKCRYVRTSHTEKRVPKVYGNKYGTHHSSKRKIHHRSRATSSSSSSSEDNSTFHKSSRHTYGKLPATHSIPTIPKKHLKQIRCGEYVHFNVSVVQAGASLTQLTKSQAQG